MTSRGPVNPAFLVPLALCVALLGGWTVYEESADVVGEPGLSSIARVVSTLGNQEIGGIWTVTQQRALMNCERTLQTRQSLEMRYLPEDVQQALPLHCERTAFSATAAYPTNSYAWSVGALAAAEQQDWTTMNDALVRSQLTGPTEYWIGVLRVAIAQDNYGKLDEVARHAADQDLKLLLVSIPGIRSVSARYINDDEFRERLEAVLKTMPAETQRRFVNIVRREIS